MMSMVYVPDEPDRCAVGSDRPFVVGEAPWPEKAKVRREVDALLYRLPVALATHGVGAGSQVYASFRRRRKRGTWDRVLSALREAQRLRASKGPRTRRSEHRFTVGQDYDAG